MTWLISDQITAGLLRLIPIMLNSGTAKQTGTVQTVDKSAQTTTTKTPGPFLKTREYSYRTHTYKFFSNFLW